MPGGRVHRRKLALRTTVSAVALLPCARTPQVLAPSPQLQKGDAEAQGYSGPHAQGAWAHHRSDPHADLQRQENQPKPPLQGPWPLPGTPWVCPVDKTGGGNLCTCEDATEAQRALLARVFTEGCSGENAPPQPPMPASPGSSQPSHVGCQTGPLESGPTDQDKEWASLIQQWKTANRKLHSRIQPLCQENTDLRRRLSATEASLDKAMGERQKALQPRIVN